jgi:hypothetical protein
MKLLRSLKLDNTRTFLGPDFARAGTAAEMQEEATKKISKSGRVNRAQISVTNLRGSIRRPMQDILRVFLIGNGRIKQ